MPSFCEWWCLQSIQVIAHWRFTKKPELSGVCKRWLRVEPTYGMLIPGEHADITLTAYIDNDTAVVRVQTQIFILLLKLHCADGYEMAVNRIPGLLRNSPLAQKFSRTSWCFTSKTALIISSMRLVDTHGRASAALWKNWSVLQSQYEIYRSHFHQRAFKGRAMHHRTRRRSPFQR